MPPILAAAPRSIPSLTPANDRSRRLWLTSFDRRAGPGHSSPQQSPRNLPAEGMARILSRQLESAPPRFGNPHVSQQPQPLVLESTVFTVSTLRGGLFQQPARGTS